MLLQNQHPNNQNCRIKCNTHDKKEKCQICYKKGIFKGDNTVDDFGQWLINEQHEGSTCIAHIGKVYDFRYLQGHRLPNGIFPSLTWVGTTKSGNMHLVHRLLNAGWMQLVEEDFSWHGCSWEWLFGRATVCADLPSSANWAEVAISLKHLLGFGIYIWPCTIQNQQAQHFLEALWNWMWVSKIGQNMTAEKGNKI